jgi:gamma-glutamylcyclotransferase (GGCT)/AIG2-like uncharacterized protein YtfP
MTGPRAPGSDRIEGTTRGGSPRTEGMHTDLFVYGTLQDPTVLGQLLDDPPPLTPVTVDGWRVAPVRGQVFPALVADEEAVARGHHLAVGPADLAVLDRFEGPAYALHPIGTGHVGAADVTLHAWVATDGLLPECDPGTWTLEGFRTDPARGEWLAAIRRGRGAPRH